MLLHLGNLGWGAEPRALQREPRAAAAASVASTPAAAGPFAVLTAAEGLRSHRVTLRRLQVPTAGGREGEGKEKKENLKPKSVQRKLEETRRRSGRRRGRGADVARTLRGPPGALAAGPGRSGAEPAEEAQ